eukprot:CAMPEP_0168581012 /NCGR_PEP_ID=MMETSP0420-20121227/1142_1 /TAXON_ID=498008 /ORGANISM="Pessonella sp." /LENGTH=499 /DNA_ID=CAMNT_0008615245 /DNA_START=290 /DNA_END=1789 /DNA_ORIENTATION=+
MLSAGLLAPLESKSATFSDDKINRFVLSDERVAPKQPPPLEHATAKHVKYASMSGGKHTTILNFHPFEIARQLTIASHALFLQVRVEEFIKRTWMKDDATKREKECPNIMRCVEQFNRINRWAASEMMLTFIDEAKRLSVLKRLIETAHHCMKLRNFHATYAIYVGLNMWAVQRLKSTWASLTTKWQKLYDEIEHLCLPNNNSKAMRDALNEATTPLVPPLDLYMRDLTAVDNLDEFVNVDEENEKEPIKIDDTRLLNYEKKVKEAAIIKSFSKAQQNRYMLQSYPPLQHYLWELREPLTDAQIKLLVEVSKEPNKIKAESSDDMVKAKAIVDDVLGGTESPAGGRRRAVSMSAKLGAVFQSKKSSTENQTVMKGLAVPQHLRQSRGRMGSTPIRPTFNVKDMEAAALEADKATDKLRKTSNPKCVSPHMRRLSAKGMAQSADLSTRRRSRGVSKPGPPALPLPLIVEEQADKPRRSISSPAPSADAPPPPLPPSPTHE